MTVANVAGARFPRLALMAALALGPLAPAMAQGGPTQLFRIVGARDEVVVGLTPAEFDGMGSAPGVERLARKLVADGQLTAWQYVVTRSPDGTTRYATTRRIAILRNDTTRIEPYTAALPVSPPPAP